VIEGLTFVDTDVVLHAQDRRDDRRRGIAQNVLGELWASGSGVVSPQVRQEFYDAGTRELKLQPEVARRVVALYAEWDMQEVRRIGDLSITNPFRPAGP
jgi:hypothetical protein